ncbi:MAG: hypothetical protein JNK77_08260 [Saprospiraceae bacterium]|nr:hypothetical protein [Saprospiraceae bacterium]
MLVRISLLLLLAITASCGVSKKSPPTELYNHWTHSHEEDSAEAKVFRPSTYAFPPSRGREGFEIKADGSFIRYAIAAADGTEKMPGRWKMKGKGVIEVTLDNKAVAPYELALVSVEKDKLILKP